MTTTITDIADFVRILNEQPEWNETIRGILLGRELLELPQRFAEFVRVTEENNRLVAERLARLETAQVETNQRLGRLETAQVETNQRLGRLETAQVETNQRLGRLETAQVETNQRLGRLETDVAGVQTDVASLQTDVAGVQTDVASLQTDVAGLREEHTETRRIVERLDHRVENLEGLYDRLDGRLGNLEGMELERQVHRDIANIASRWLGFNRVRILQSHIVVRSPEFQDAIDAAEERNLITDEQAAHLERTDVIVSARRRDDRQDVHVAIEVSRSIADRDITRASERAQSLAAVLETPAVSVVVGAGIEQSQQELADRLGVSVIVLPRLVVSP